MIVGDLVTCEPHALQVELAEALHKAAMYFSVEPLQLRVLREDHTAHGLEVRTLEGRDQCGFAQRAIEHAFGQCSKATFPRNPDAIHKSDPSRDSFRRFLPIGDSIKNAGD